jgi:Xaa-Pro aminopeptidase
MKAALREFGVADGRVGLDHVDVLGYQALDREGVEIVDGQEVVERARMIKTDDEVALLRISCSVADHALDQISRAIRPGVREIDLLGIMAETTVRDGGEFLEARLVLSGGNTNPWLGEASDRMIRSGDLVGVDTDMVGPLGYFNCVARTFVCGRRGTSRQKALYRRTYEFIEATIPLMQPGVALSDVAKKLPEVPEEFRAQRYSLVSHGCGLQSEYPRVYFPDVRPSSNEVLRENMVLTVEAYFGAVGEGEGTKLSDMILIRSDGPEIISPCPFDDRLLD